MDRSRELARKFQQKRSTSSGALRSHKRRELAKRSMSSRSLKGSSLGDDEPFPTDSSGNAKSPGKNKFRFARPKPGGKQTRSNSFSAMATKMIDFDGDDGESDEKEEVLSFSEHVQRITRVKKTNSGDNLSKSDHGIGRKDGGKFISKSDHEVGTRPLLRGKRPDRVSKSPSNMRDSKRESKSKSPTAIPRKKIDLAKSESRSPSAMQRKKAEARNESMRKFEEILGKRDIDTTSPSIFKKKIDVNSPKRESKKLDPNESRGGSKSPSSMRRKKLEAFCRHCDCLVFDWCFRDVGKHNANHGDDFGLHVNVYFNWDPHRYFYGTIQWRTKGDSAGARRDANHAELCVPHPSGDVAWHLTCAWFDSRSDLCDCSGYPTHQPRYSFG